MDELNDIEVQLWEYIDGLVEEPRRSAIGKLIAENSEWRTKYDELLETHLLLAQTELEQPSLRFTRNVLEAIAREQIAPATRQYINKRVIWGIAGFFLTVIVALVIYGISQIDWTTPATAKGPGGIDLANVDYSRVFDNNLVNLFLMGNIVLALFLLDRFLAARRRQQIDSL
jgi:hypothetical protein